MCLQTRSMLVQLQVSIIILFLPFQGRGSLQRFHLISQYWIHLKSSRRTTHFSPALWLLTARGQRTQGRAVVQRTVHTRQVTCDSEITRSRHSDKKSLLILLDVYQERITRNPLSVLCALVFTYNIIIHACGYDIVPYLRPPTIVAV